MKTCTKCKTTKDELEFHKNIVIKDGLCSYCKQCVRNKSKKYAHSKNGLITTIYNNQRGSSRHRHHPMPAYTNRELRDWLLSKKKFHILYDSWKRRGFSMMHAPSVDRIDDSIGYTMLNIQIMTWKQNKQKCHDDMRSGKLKHGHKPQKTVSQFTKENKFIAEYVSTREASRQTGSSQSAISLCCNGKQDGDGSFKWEFAKAKK